MMVLVAVSRQAGRITASPTAATRCLGTFMIRFRPGPASQGLAGHEVPFKLTGDGPGVSAQDEDTVTGSEGELTGASEVERGLAFADPVLEEPRRRLGGGERAGVERRAPALEEGEDARVRGPGRDHVVARDEVGSGRAALDRVGERLEARGERPEERVGSGAKAEGTGAWVHAR